MRRGTSVPSHLNRRHSKLEECRPSSTGEEDLQLQIALALSREEAQKEEEMRRGDEARLQMAVMESRKAQQNSPPLSSGRSATGASGGGSAIDDLLSLGATASASANHNYFQSQHQQVDAWGAPLSHAAQPQPPRPASAPYNDPWATSVLPQQRAGTASAAVVHDPWSSSPPVGGNVQVKNDPWAPVGQSESTTAQHHNNLFGASGSNHNSNDPWNMDPMSQMLPSMQPATRDGLDSLSGTVAGNDQLGMGKSRNLKTPESFLGENSALVNLHNLMGPPKQSAPGLSTAKTSTNPFLGQTTAATNPFLVQQGPSPTLNQMRTGQTLGGNQQPMASNGWAASSGVGQAPSSGASGADAWSLPPPLQPQNAAATANNPFL